MALGGGLGAVPRARAPCRSAQGRAPPHAALCTPCPAQDKEAKSSYNLNPPVSEEFKFFTASVFSNPLEVLADWFDGIGEIGNFAFTTDYVVAGSKKIGDKTPPPAPKKPAKGKKDPLRAIGEKGAFNFFGAGATKF